MFDCVIVGARCAGAPLAAHLCRAGMKVCLVDSAKLPSDQPFSTHALLPAGVGYLEELGVADRVRAVTPAVRVARLNVGGSVLDIELRRENEVLCPRRSTLDPILLETAVAAGAELRDETAVTDVLREGDRVVGVKVRNGAGVTDVRSRFVVGADGRNSTIARLVGASEYHSSETPRGGYWSYWPMTPAFEKLPFQTFIDIRKDLAGFAFRTDGGLVICGALDRREVVRGWIDDIEKNLRARLMDSEVTACLVEGNQPVTPPVGLLKLKLFFREATGPGWALVGDAGLTKDPTPGYGITDALRDAKALSLALLDGRPLALERYWRARDVESFPLFTNANAMGGLDYDNPFNRLIIARVAQDPALRVRMREVMERKLSPFEAIPPANVLGWTGKALLRGHFDVLSPFLSSAKLGSLVEREVKKKTALLRDVERRLSA